MDHRRSRSLHVGGDGCRWQPRVQGTRGFDSLHQWHAAVLCASCTGGDWQRSSRLDRSELSSLRLCARCPWSGWPAADGTLARYAPRRGCTVGEIMYPIRWVTHLSPSEQGNMCCGWEPGRPDFSLASVEARNLYAANGSTKLAGMAAKHRWSTWAGRVSHRAQSFG
jgi:hypothetical protein